MLAKGDAASRVFSCPQCHAQVSARDADCPTCGINLALAATLAERQLLAAAPPSSTPYIGDVILPRFGEFLVSGRYISESQLAEGLTRQREAAERGYSVTIGQALLEMGVVTRDQLDLASIQQVRQLQNALQESNRQLEQRVARRTQELQQALQKLAQLNELKANFVANISHELRTPLTHIQGYNSLVVNGTLGPLNAEQRDALTVSAKAIGQLGKLINDLIQFATIATGGMLLKPIALSLTGIGRRAVAAVQARAEQADVGLFAQISDDLPLVMVDQENIYWVLVELLENAIKFTSGGEVVALTMIADESYVSVSLRDTGIGIAPERLSEIFEPFHQLDSSSTRRYGGTGLGLAMVKKIVEAHDATLQVESEPGSGTTISFMLPVVMSA